MREATEDVITDEKIIEYVRRLSVSLGVRKNVSESTLGKIEKLYESRLISRCIAEIKALLRLELTLRVGYLKGSPSQTGMIKLIKKGIRSLGYQMPDSVFQPDNFKNLQDMSDVGATIFCPPDLPLYGTPAFNNFKVLLFISEHTQNRSFEVFVYCIAHELTHVILYAIQHPLRSSETATDLATMILGFSDVIGISRKLEDGNCGYLEDNQFYLAYQEIRKRREIIYL